MWQDAFVTMIAVGAIGLLVRRQVMARSRPAGACPSCASGPSCTQSQTLPGPAAQADDVKPLVFVRRSKRS